MFLPECFVVAASAAMLCDCKVDANAKCLTEIATSFLRQLKLHFKSETDSFDFRYTILSLYLAKNLHLSGGGGGGLFQQQQNQNGGVSQCNLLTLWHLHVYF